MPMVCVPHFRVFLNQVDTNRTIGPNLEVVE